MKSSLLLLFGIVLLAPALSAAPVDPMTAMMVGQMASQEAQAIPNMMAQQAQNKFMREQSTTQTIAAVANNAKEQTMQRHGMASGNFQTSMALNQNAEMQAQNLQMAGAHAEMGTLRAFLMAEEANAAAGG